MSFFPAARLGVLLAAAMGAAGLTWWYTQPPALPPAPAGMVTVPGGPDAHGREVAPFFMDKSPVTVAEFGQFVAATGYRTQAEAFGDAGVLDYRTGQWTLVKGANYRQPRGADQPAAPPDHPVTQVSWNDAQAYCRWANKRLPTRQEWEHASRNAQADYAKTYPWGDQLVQNGRYLANTWQGTFPALNTGADGFLYTSPVGHFGATPLGLTDLGGNVWQWCADWWDEPATERLQMGGSFLCDPGVCHGFKVAGQAHATPETSLMHVGFRCVKDVSSSQ
ncbi:MAG: formylglycine-generating enzyme family protein [Bernardetiaceae bacterium]|nr:formylglycine-generating enzyme family protein [Bernardetiaceae bacterium]